MIEMLTNKNLISFYYYFNFNELQYDKYEMYYLTNNEININFMQSYRTLLIFGFIRYYNYISNEIILLLIIYSFYRYFQNELKQLNHCNINNTKMNYYNMPILSLPPISNLNQSKRDVSNISNISNVSNHPNTSNVSKVSNVSIVSSFLFVLFLFCFGFVFYVHIFLFCFFKHRYPERRKPL